MITNTSGFNRKKVNKKLLKSLKKCTLCGSGSLSKCRGTGNLERGYVLDVYLKQTLKPFKEDVPIT